MIVYISNLHYPSQLRTLKAVCHEFAGFIIPTSIHQMYPAISTFTTLIILLKKGFLSFISSQLGILYYLVYVCDLIHELFFLSHECNIVSSKIFNFMTMKWTRTLLSRPYWVGEVVGA